MAASKLCRHTGQVGWAGDGARWRQTVVLAKVRWRAPAAQPRGADPHKGQHGRTMASGGKWRQAGSMAVAAGGRDNGNQGRGRDLVEKLDYPFWASFFFAQKLGLA